jgi:hypothetical protein
VVLTWASFFPAPSLSFFELCRVKMSDQYYNSQSATRTIFLVGFPVDWTQRELFNLFACADGFENSSLSTDRQGQMTAFARFDSTENAASAIRKLDKRIIDQTTQRWLDCSFAQHDLTIDSPIGLYSDATASAPQGKKRRYEVTTPMQQTSPLGAMFPSQPMVSYTPTPYQSQISPLASTCPTTDLVNPPCPTMFIGKIPFGVTQEQLLPIFSCLQGFKKLSFNTKCAFVEFVSTQHCVAAMNSLKGRCVVTPGSPPLNVCFAKPKPQMG